MFFLRLFYLSFIFNFFFFKQKTAYDMRISDWSSDVCSSDLLVPEELGIRQAGVEHALVAGDHLLAAVVGQRIGDDHEARRPRTVGGIQREIFLMRPHGGGQHLARHRRSAEHPSELQSLMRISYAVFCLKKKTIKTNNNITNYL